MGRADPFFGYSLILRTIVLGLVPAFAAWQLLRLRRAFHVFQLESYKRPWFRGWCSADRRRALFLRSFVDAKKPLAMTGRAWRTIITATLLTVLGILIPAGIVHLVAGAPFDLLTCGVMFALMFSFPDRLLLLADLVLTPVQRAINRLYLERARRRLDEVRPLVIGVTGSFGKTSTKFAIARILGPPEEVLATPSSFNTTLGVCRTINEQLRPAHRFFVVEMGARREGDVAEVCRLVRPRIGVLTAIGPAHLETFGSIEAVRRAKYEIIAALPPGGVAVMSSDDPEVRALATATGGPAVVRYGVEREGSPRVGARDIEVHARGTDFTIVDEESGEKLRVGTRLLGKHAIGHVLAGVGVALATGHRLEELGSRIEGMEPAEHRLQLIEGAGGVTVIDDAYNSNPDGAAAALEVLAAMPARKRVIVTPGIVEMGAQQDAANEELGRRAAEVCDTLIFVAKLNRTALVAGAEAAGTGGTGGAEVLVADSLAEATELMRSLIGPGDVVLFENDLPDQYEG